MQKQLLKIKFSTQCPQSHAKEYGSGCHLGHDASLAGKELHFNCSIAEIRDATSEEIEHGHAHGPGGHQHD